MHVLTTVIVRNYHTAVHMYYEVHNYDVNTVELPFISLTHALIIISGSVKRVL